MRNKLSKTASLLLSMALFIAMSSTVFAQTNEAKIGETGYSTLEDAFANANDGDTITVTADSTLDARVTIG